jgi:ribosome modulation factor
MVPSALPDNDQNWSLESLNKAYQQGYMAGLTGHTLQLQPYSAEVLAAAWEAGWADGDEQFKLYLQKAPKYKRRAQCSASMCPANPPQSTHNPHAQKRATA